MSLIKCNKQLIIRLRNLPRCFSTAVKEEEYTTTPNYPPILDLSFEAKVKRRKAAEHEEIKNVKTVEEKQIKLNMPRYYGFKTYMLTEDYIPYNSLQLVQHCTRTHLIESSALPSYYDNLSIEVADVQKDIEEALLMEIEGYRKAHDLKNEEISEVEKRNLIGSSISKQLNRIFITRMGKSYKHLQDVQVDLDPRIEACWFVGGMNPPENIKRCRKGIDWLKYMENEPTDRLINYIGNPYLTIRAELPLHSIIAHNESENEKYEVPYFQYDPRVVGTKTDYRRIVNTPGYWPGDSHEFGLLQFLKRGHHLTRHYNDADEKKDALHRQGVLASFGWLSAQANMLGFNTFNEITYPLVTQTVLTDGQLFSFYIYQLNTLLLHSEHTKENPKRNICWATPELKLYEGVQDGKLVGFNEDVLKMLTKLYVNSPEERLGINLRPYLSSEEKVIADYADDEKRNWLEREYKFITSNRPRQHLSYEIYHWEKIYKIDHKTRFMEARRRPFELREQPFNRRYDDRKPRYIPRALRPELPRHKGRDAKEFFP